MEKFSYEANGYNRNEVNQFVKDVIKETEGVLSRVKRQAKEIEELKKKIKHYKELESKWNDAILKAEETENQIKKIAQEESKIIITEAKQNASRIINDSLLRAEKIEQNADTLERNMRIFKRKLKRIMEQQMAVVEEIEILELDP